MRRFIRTSLALTLALSMVVVSVGGCTKPGVSSKDSTDDVVVTPDVTESPADAAKRLGEALANAEDLDTARPVVREILARCGAKVQTAAGELRAQPVEPVASIWYFDFQADNLALDYLEDQGLTLEQLSQCLAEYPEPGAEFWQDPLVLREFMKEMWLAAYRNPQDPLSFGPLMLAELQYWRDPMVSISDDSANPATYPMSYLEILIFGLSVSRGIPVGEPTSAAPALGSAETVVCVPKTPWYSDIVALVDTPAYASNPCSWLEEKWGKDMKDLANAGVGRGIDEGLEAAAGKATEAASEAAKTAGKGAAMAVGWVTALVSMVATVGGYSLSVTAEPVKAHYEGYNPHHGDTDVKFVAHVSSRPVADKDLQACLDWAGVELPDEKSAEDAIVRWVGGYGTDSYGKPIHAQILKKGLDTSSTGGGGRLESKVGSDGVAEIFLLMSTEKDGLRDKGILKKDKITIQAELFVQNPGGGKIVGSVIFGGVPDMVKAWADKWFPKKATGTMQVEYHVKGKYGFTDNYDDGTWTIITAGEGAQGLYGPWTVTTTGQGNNFGATGTINGTLSFTLVEGSRAPVTGNLMMELASPLSPDIGGTSGGPVTGSAWIEGTPEAPVLVIEQNYDVTASGWVGSMKESSSNSGTTTSRYTLVVTEEQ